MELNNLDNIFLVLQQFLQKSMHNKTWFIEKDDIQEVLIVRKKLGKTHLPESETSKSNLQICNIVKVEHPTLSEVRDEVHTQEELECSFNSDDELSTVLKVEEQPQPSMNQFSPSHRNSNDNEAISKLHEGTPFLAQKIDAINSDWKSSVVYADGYETRHSSQSVKNCHGFTSFKSEVAESNPPEEQVETLVGSESANLSPGAKTKKQNSEMDPISGSSKRRKPAKQSAKNKTEYKMPLGKTKKKSTGRPSKYAGTSRIENGVRIHQCTICKMDFKSYKWLRNHNASSHGGSIPSHSCNLCHRVYDHPKELKKHQDYLHNDNIGEYACEFCNKRFALKETLNDHQRTSHPSDDSKLKISNCTFCNKPYRGYREKHQHLLQDHADELLYCSFDRCHKYYDDEKLLVKHLKSLHHDTSRLYQCAFCGMDWIFPDSLTYHEDEKHEYETSHLEKLYACQMSHCQKRFRKESFLKKHDKTSHATSDKKKTTAINTSESSEKSPCPTCGKLIPSMKLKFHIRSHDKHKCDECGKTYCSTNKLSNHRLNKHGNAKYFCPYDSCPKPFSSRATLRFHVKTIHESKRDLHQCDQCEKSFAYASDLKIHKKALHEGLMSRCAFCGKEFARTSEKNRHEKKTHGFKPGDLASTQEH